MPQFTVPRPTTVARPLARGFDVLFGEGANGIYARLMPQGVQPIARVTAPAAADAFQTGVNPEDFGDADGSKTFSRSDFTKGEGLGEAHDRAIQPRDFGRFWDSLGIDIRDDDRGAGRRIQLAREPETIFSEGVGVAKIGLVSDGSSLWWSDYNEFNVNRSDNPLAATPTLTQAEDPHAGEGNQNIQDLAILEGQVYASITTNGTHRRNSAGTWTHWSDLIPSRMWTAKGRVFGVTGTTVESLYEMGSLATSVLLATHDSGGFAGNGWRGVVDAGAAILAARDARDRSLIISYVDEGGTLTEVAQTELVQERIVSIGARGGVVLILTGASSGASSASSPMRLWRGTLNASFALDLQLLREWATGTPGSADGKKMFATRDHIYFVFAEGSPFSLLSLWRYDLATAALSRVSDGWPVTQVGGDGEPLIAIEDRIFLATFADGVHREADTYRSTGYLISPIADFYSAKDKQWTSARLWASEALPTDTGAVLAYTTDPAAIEDSADPSWTDVVTLAGGATGGDETNIAATAKSRWAAFRITLTPNGAQTLTPSVRAASLRAYPDYDEVVYDFPINISDHLDRPKRRRRFMRGYGEQMWAQIKALEGDTLLVELLRPNEKIRGVIESVSMPITDAAERGSRTTMCVVRVRGRKE